MSTLLNIQRARKAAGVTPPLDAVRSSRKNVEELMGERVLVYAPKEAKAPEWFGHLHMVELRGFSPLHVDIVRTSKGPLQYTRTGCYFGVSPDTAARCYG